MLKARCGCKIVVTVPLLVYHEDQKKTRDRRTFLLDVSFRPFCMCVGMQVNKVEGWEKHSCRVQEGRATIQLFVRVDHVC